ncbi:MAG TPA: NAD(P)H-dependent oxidoreductase [Kineosporiaceae bacterium]
MRSEELAGQPGDLESPLSVAVIVGSSRKGRVGGTVADWFVSRVSRPDIKLDVIDVATLNLPLDLTATPAVREFTERIRSADAFVVVTPEYNHGYPSGLKLAIDSVRSEWAAKPVAFVSYGGLSGGLRAVDQLRQVFAELHMVSIRDTVSFHQVRQCFDASGNLLDPAPAEAAAALLLDRIVWWGQALRAARRIDPYAD